MLNELLARVQAYADERQLNLHRGTIQRVVYSAQDIVDGQYTALSIHFERDRDVIYDKLGKIDKSWHVFYGHKLDTIRILEYDLHAYHSLYKNLLKTHITKARALEILSNEALLRKYEQMFKLLYDNADEHDEWQLFGNIVFDIDMVFECNA